MAKTSKPTMGRADASGSAIKSGKAVLSAAEKSGPPGEKSARVGGRISAALLEQPKKQMGISSDPDLIEFALANVALEEDAFSEAFDKVRGTVHPSLKLGF